MTVKSWTAVPEEEVMSVYRTFSLPKLRHHQDLVGQQIRMAHNQRNIEALESLRYAERLLAEAIMERV